jgi:hypothetical protein
VIAQIIVMTLHYRLTRINQRTEEVKLVRELYRQFYLQEKSYLQIAGGIESCQKLYKTDGGSFSQWPSTTISASSATSVCSWRAAPSARNSSAIFLARYHRGL